jgi:Domain of unknown function (DUF4440)/Domain of unknown function (DUF3471)
MRHLSFLLIALSTAASFAHTSEEQQFSPEEQELVNVQRARMDAAARRDLEAWSGYVAEDCIFSGDDGSLLTKAQMISYYKKVPAEYDRALDPREYTVHLYGNTAVVNLRATDHEPAGGIDITAEQRRTETFIKRNDSWVAIAIQWTALPINHRKPVSTDRRSFQEYVGQYKARPKDDVETISMKDGRLWSQTGENGDWCEYAGDETFFYKSDVGQFTFSRDAQGRVKGYTYRRSDGQEIYSQKIK